MLRSLGRHAPPGAGQRDRRGRRAGRLSPRCWASPPAWHPRPSTPCSRPSAPTIPTSGIALAPRTIVIRSWWGSARARRGAGARAAGDARAARAALHEAPRCRVGRQRYAAVIAAVAALVASGARRRHVRSRLYLARLPRGSRRRAHLVAVAMVAKHVVRPLASVIGWPAAKLAGQQRRLARENATRNPRATEPTAAAS